MATLTYAYADRAAVLGPLAAAPEPGSYDLCASHAERTSAPQGWEIFRLPLDARPKRPEEPPGDDLMALAEAVRSIGLRHDEPTPPPTSQPLPNRRGGHLRLLPATD